MVEGWSDGSHPAMKGRKPKPIEERIRAGNPGHRALPEPLMIAGRPELAEMMRAPRYLPKEGRDYWRSTVTRLVEIGMIDRVDRAALEMLATSYARWRQAVAMLADQDLLVLGARAQLKQHPAIRIERDAATLYMRTAEHFGVTPIARSRLGLAEVHRRSLEAEMASALEVEPIDAVLVEDVELPGV